MNDTIAREIARTLKSSGVNDFFMLTGGDQPFWIALRDEGIRMLVAVKANGELAEQRGPVAGVGLRHRLHPKPRGLVFDDP